MKKLTATKAWFLSATAPSLSARIDESWKILQLPADVLQAELPRTSMSVSAKTNLLFLSVRPSLFLVRSRSLSGRHLSTSFLDPVLGAMMSQVCRQTLKSLASECLVGVRLDFLTPVCVD